MIEQGDNSKSYVQPDFVSGKQMICLLCLFRVAAGSMPVLLLYVALDQGKEAKLLHVRLTGKLFTASAADYKPE